MGCRMERWRRWDEPLVVLLRKRRRLGSWLDRTLAPAAAPGAPTNQVAPHAARATDPNAPHQVVSRCRQRAALRRRHRVGNHPTTDGARRLQAFFFAALKGALDTARMSRHRKL